MSRITIHCKMVRFAIAATTFAAVSTLSVNVNSAEEAPICTKAGYFKMPPSKDFVEDRGRYYRCVWSAAANKFISVGWTACPKGTWFDEAQVKCL